LCILVGLIIGLDQSPIKMHGRKNATYKPGVIIIIIIIIIINACMLIDVGM
jgi:hypothetical protein